MSGNGQLQFRDLVREDLVLGNAVFDTRDDALKTMASILVEREFCEEPYVEAILERERAHPSALPMPGHKIAIPHTDATYVKRSALLFARLKKPVEFRSMGDPDEKLQVSMISMFALKEKKLIGDLLETLITFYQDESVLESIYGAADGGTIYRILRDHVERSQVQR
jgi:galactitol PTS system EIIA component